MTVACVYDSMLLFILRKQKQNINKNGKNK